MRNQAYVAPAFIAGAYAGDKLKEDIGVIGRWRQAHAIGGSQSQRGGTACVLTPVVSPISSHGVRHGFIAMLPAPDREAHRR